MGEDGRESDPVIAGLQRELRQTRLLASLALLVTVVAVGVAVLRGLHSPIQADRVVTRDLVIVDSHGKRIGEFSGRSGFPSLTIGGPAKDQPATLLSGGWHEPEIAMGVLDSTSVQVNLLSGREATGLMSGSAWMRKHGTEVHFEFDSAGTPGLWVRALNGTHGRFMFSPTTVPTISPHR